MIYLQEMNMSLQSRGKSSGCSGNDSVEIPPVKSIQVTVDNKVLKIC